jgi:hypothetical protein
MIKGKVRSTDKEFGTQVELSEEEPEEDLEEFEEAWDENSFEGVEELGWSNDDTEFEFQGPLLLVNEDTGEEFNGEKIKESMPEKVVVESKPLNPTAAWPFGNPGASTVETAKWPFETNTKEEE